MKLLTVGNPKVIKGEKLGYLTAILHLAPANMSGYQVCPMATVGCTNGCLNTAGHGGMFKGGSKHLTSAEVVAAITDGRITNIVQAARIRRTRMFFETRVEFMAQLETEITAFVKRAGRKNLIPVVRLNGTSDIRWENYGIIDKFPTIQFYDYTKIPNRRNLPANYHLTFSLADGNDANAWIAGVTQNVAVVFRTDRFPETFMNRRVISGDEHDLRFLDSEHVVVGLKAKGRAKQDKTGFVKNV